MEFSGSETSLVAYVMAVRVAGPTSMRERQDFWLPGCSLRKVELPFTEAAKTEHSFGAFVRESRVQAEEAGWR